MSKRKISPVDTERYNAIFVTLKNARSLLHGACSELLYTERSDPGMAEAIRNASEALKAVQLDCARRADPDAAALLDAPKT
jgi:hypothetical protein